MPQIPNIGSYFSDRVLHLAAKVVTIFGYLGSEDFAGLYALGFPVGSKVSSGLLDLLLDVRR